MKSLYQRQLVIMTGVVLVSFFLLGVAFISLSYRYTISERQGTMQYNASYIAQEASELITSSVEEGGFILRAALFQPTIEAVAGVSGTTVMLCVQDGQIIYASDDTGEADMNLVGQYVPDRMVDLVYASGGWSGMGTLDDLFDSNRYVAAQSIIISQNGVDMVAGMVVVISEDSNVTALWRGFASIFFTTALVVLFIAFVTSSVTSLKMTRPLQDMAEAVRRFGHGEYDVRVNCGNRCDEVGELAEAFNIMADSIAKSEAQRSEFVANVSHELKTPMTTIAGFADGILDGTIPPEREGEYLKTISAETRRLSRLVRRMLDLSRLQAGEDVTAQEQFDISEVMLRVLVSLERKINDRGLDVETKLPDEAIQVWGDPDAITQVCYNLLDNAIKFSTPGTALGIRMEVKGGKAYVGVRNFGETIDPDQLPLLFDRFHKTDRSRSEDREGVGLGLYIVKTILNNHHENIMCTSQEGVTEFVFTLTQV